MAYVWDNATSTNLTVLSCTDRSGLANVDQQGLQRLTQKPIVCEKCFLISSKQDQGQYISDTKLSVLSHLSALIHCSCLQKKKKKNFTSFCQPTRLITCANYGNYVQIFIKSDSL